MQRLHSLLWQHCSRVEIECSQLQASQLLHGTCCSGVPRLTPNAKSCNHRQLPKSVDHSGYEFCCTMCTTLLVFHNRTWATIFCFSTHLGRHICVQHLLLYIFLLLGVLLSLLDLFPNMNQVLSCISFQAWFRKLWFFFVDQPQHNICSWQLCCDWIAGMQNHDDNDNTTATSKKSTDRLLWLRNLVSESNYFWAIATVRILLKITWKILCGNLKIFFFLSQIFIETMYCTGSQKRQGAGGKWQGTQKNNRVGLATSRTLYKYVEVNIKRNKIIHSNIIIGLIRSVNRMCAYI